MAITDHIPHIPNPPPGQIRPCPEPIIIGRIPFSYQGSASSLCGETAYFICGDPASRKTPLLVIYGGLGMVHDYMLPFAFIAEDYGIPVIMYGQIGCGQSSRFKDQARNESLWTLEMFMEELATMIEHLQLKQFDLLGHSWGGFLSGKFATQEQPSGMRKLIICSSPPSLKLMEPISARLRRSMPKQVQDVIDQCEELDSFDPTEGQAAMQYAYTLHGCRVTPWPKELLAVLLGLAENRAVYETLAGSSAFTIKGLMTKVVGLQDRICESTEKTCPGGLLVVTADFDLASQEIMTAWLQEPKCKVKHVHLMLSSHSVMLEVTEELMKAIGAFLES